MVEMLAHLKVLLMALLMVLLMVLLWVDQMVLRRAKRTVHPTVDLLESSVQLLVHQWVNCLVLH